MPAKYRPDDSTECYQQDLNQGYANFFVDLKSVVITLMMREAKSADQNPVTSNFSLQRAVSDNIAAFTTKRKRPKVTIETGKVRTLMMDPKKLLISPKRRATQR